MIPKTITFNEIKNWDNLCISNFDTLYQLNHSIFKKHPNICCQHKYQEWVDNINNNPTLKSMFKKEYDRIVNIHSKYDFKETGIKNIRNIGFVNFVFITEEMCEKLIILYGDTYMTKNIENEQQLEPIGNPIDIELLTIANPPIKTNKKNKKK